MNNVIFLIVHATSLPFKSPVHLLPSANLAISHAVVRMSGRRVQHWSKTWVVHNVAIWRRRSTSRCHCVAKLDLKTVDSGRIVTNNRKINEVLDLLKWPFIVFDSKSWRHSVAIQNWAKTVKHSGLGLKLAAAWENI